MSDIFKYPVEQWARQCLTGMSAPAAKHDEVEYTLIFKPESAGGVSRELTRTIKQHGRGKPGVHGARSCAISKAAGGLSRVLTVLEKLAESV